MTTPHEKQLILIARKAEELKNHDLPVLQQRGNFDIMTTETGFEAIRVCKENRFVCLALISSDLPDINGFETCIIIRRQRPTLPLILIMNYVTTESLRFANMIGGIRIIQNPLQPTDLEIIINEYLRSVPQIEKARQA